MHTQPNSTYYTERRSRLLKEHDGIMSAARPVLIEQYGEPVAEILIRQAGDQYEQLIPKFPYIGGKQNRMTDTLIKCASLLALYRVTQQQGISVEESGELVYRIAQAWVAAHPALLRDLIGRLYMSGFWRRKTWQGAEQSQQRQYPEDFVYEVVEGDGEAFDWGVNYRECAIVKFFRAQGAGEFAPYMCQLDYALFQGLNIGLERTQTIAQGGAYCDFRFKRGRPTPDGWPPKFLREQER